MDGVLTIEDLFAGRLFRVPDYQRGYAWEKTPHLEDFIDDLEALEPESQHYTGTIVLHDQVQPSVFDKEGNSYRLFDIVDGQQRLTSIVLLLDAIRTLVHATHPTIAEGIQKKFIYVKNLNDQPLYRLRLNSDCHEFLIHNVLAEPGGPQGPTITSHRRLADAKHYFLDYLAGHQDTLGVEFPEWLLKLYAKIIRQLRVSTYSVERTTEVGVIFEVMNNRGKPLSDLEKVKNYLLYLSSKLEIHNDHELENQVNSTWAEIFQRLMAHELNSSGDEDRLLRAHWMVYKNPNSRDFSGSASIKKEFNLKVKEYQGKHDQLLTDLLHYVSTLRDAVVPFCEAFLPGTNTAFSAWSANDRLKVVRAAEKLRRTRLIAPFLPILIATRLKFPDDPTRYLKLLSLCEQFAFRVYVMKERRADAGQNKLHRLAHDLYIGGRTFDEMLVSMRHRALSLCSNEEFQKQFDLNESENQWYGWKGLKYFLYEYEEFLAGNKKILVAWSRIDIPDLRTIEHILPQTASNKCWKDAFSLAQRRRLTHDVGNLCLTEDNSRYGNKCFDEKRGLPGVGYCYANSNLFQERELAAMQSWDEEALLIRRGKLAEFALNRWHLDDSDMDVGAVLAAADESADEEVLA